MATKQKVKERPILMSAPLVRAILRPVDPKSETRRVSTFQDEPIAVERFHPTKIDKDGNEYPGDEIFGVYGDGWHLKCPYGAPGERIWVRESFYNDNPGGEDLESIYYRADSMDENWCCQLIPECSCVEVGKPKLTPSIFMPRWASRLTLEVTDIGFERLQEITDADAIAEGLESLDEFKSIWQKINGKDSWDENPWVWVVKFKRLEST